MIKGLFFARRKPGISPRKFQHYWRTTHAEITKPLTHILWYIQSHTLLSSYSNPDMPNGGSEPAYDGMATMWFNSMEERRVGNMTSAAQAAIDDQANFTELSARRFLMTDGVVQKDGPPGGIHLVALAMRKSGSSVEEFQRYWREHHGPLAVRIPGLRRYVQNHPRPELYGGRNAPLCDGVAEAWFDSLEELEQSNASPEMKSVRADEPNFIDTSGIIFILTEDIEIFRRF
jgi:uncharacterized protein (TIGR02118 family)